MSKRHHQRRGPIHCRATIIFAIVMTAVGSLPAYAQETFPTYELEIPVEIQFDRNYRADDPAARHSQLFATIEPAVTLSFTKELSLFVHGVIEPMVDPGPSENRYFKDHGIYLEDITVRYENDRFEVFGGKFTANFGRAWDIAPGIYGTDVASADYELSERVGFGGGVPIPIQVGGRHRISASTFFLDTSPLAQSVGRSRGTRSLADGGVSNTEDFSSFAVALDGGEFRSLPSLAYHVAYSRQGAGQDGNADQNGIAAALSWAHKLSDDLSLDPVVAEWVYLDDAAGMSGQDRTIYTLGAQMNWRSWNVALS
ncbi:MAG: hypothetical protein O3A84_10220 [Proteobacteria bacterium]|nr:hypothetical protein [Pseudomonadota bacterium]